MHLDAGAGVLSSCSCQAVRLWLPQVACRREHGTQAACTAKPGADLTGELLDADFLKALELAAPCLQCKAWLAPRMLLRQLLRQLVGLQWLEFTACNLIPACHATLLPTK